MVNTSSSSVGGTGLIPGWRARISQALQPKTKTKDKSNIVTNSIKILKMCAVLNHSVVSDSL